MDELKAKWAAASLTGKLLIIFTVPFLVFLFIMKVMSGVRVATDQNKRKEVDDKSNQLDQQKAQVNQDISKEEGKLEQLEEDKKAAIEKTKTDNPDDFYKNRYDK